jgi:cyclase
MRIHKSLAAKSIVIAAAGIVLTGVCLKLTAQQQNFDNVQVQVLPVQGNVYMMSGAGGNVTVQVGKNGVLLVDTEFGPLVPKLMTEIRKLSKGPLSFIINTHVHPDHVGGNEAFAKLVARDPRSTERDNLRPLRFVAHENVLNRMTQPVTGNQAPPAQEGLPTDEYFTRYKDLNFNGEGIVIYHEPKAHTDGDSIVFFRGSDVISAGDIFTPASYPFIDVDRGGSVGGEIAALNHILELAIPLKTQEGGTYIIPGHGHICDEADVVEFRDMVVIVKDRVQDMMKKGMNLQQIKAARPSRDYDTEYSNANSFVKPDQFVEAIYKSLGGK